MYFEQNRGISATRLQVGSRVSEHFYCISVHISTQAAQALGMRFIRLCLKMVQNKE